jgi:hypothetical protein
MNFQNNIIEKILFLLKKYQLYIEFLIVSLFILAPVLRDGYIFLLDSFFTPHLGWRLDWRSPMLFWNLLETSFVKLLGAVIFEKILFLMIIFLILIGAYNLPNTENKWVRYFVAFFYLFNPFVYSRFLYGHLMVLLSYALLPFLFKKFLDFLEQKTRVEIIFVSLLLFFISTIENHFIFFIFVSFLIIILFTILFKMLLKSNTQATYLKNIFIGNIKIVILFLLFISYWLIPSLLGKTDISRIINQQIDQKHLSAFRTASDQKYGVVLNTSAMYGFWGDREGRYALQKEMVPYWFELYVVMLLIVLWGAVCGLRDKKSRPITLSFIFIGIISLVLAVGVAYPPFEPLIIWLNNHIPFYKGYREPQKWVAMLILAYIYLGALGVEDLIPRLQNRIIKIMSNVKGQWSKVLWSKLQLAVPAFFIMLPLLYSFGMLNGFQGQMYVSNYPASWFEVNDLLNKDSDNFKTLFLPWHQYMHFGFAGKVISNPAVNFFEKPVLAGDNMEMGSIYTQTSNPDSQYIEKEIINTKENLENFGEKLMKLNIKYIILAKESDFASYGFIDKQADLEKIYEKDRIVVYRILQWGK